MRVTNKMIMNNAASNINSTKEIVNQRNTQMTTQKKIDKPSDDPVIAVRSLRLSTTLSQVTQYYQKNIPDASSWIEVTETSLLNIRDLITDCKTLADKGANGSLNQEDRNTIITQLESLQKAVFKEGNADYANRTVFTGYRTNSDLVFTKNETDTEYQITQTLSIEKNMEEHRYYNGITKVPTTKTEVAAVTNINDMAQTNYYRVRLNYDDVLSRDNFVVTDAAGNEITVDITDFANETDWADYEVADGANPGEFLKKKGEKTVPDDSIYFIRETGDIILGNNIAAQLKAADAKIDITYTKKGFKEGELRPEYYYNCTKTADPLDVNVPVEYKKFTPDGETIHYDIQYTVAAGQTININTEASDVFNSDVLRDITEMLDAVKNARNAHNKLDEIKKMKDESQYANEDDQAYLQQWYDAVKKEADYFDDNLKKLFSTEIGKTAMYCDKISLSITDLGCKKDSLDLTKIRVGDQRQTVQGLQSTNDDVDLSQIIIDYTAAYTAYQASLTAAGKLGDSTLLNYL